MKTEERGITARLRSVPVYMAGHELCLLAADIIDDLKKHVSELEGSLERQKQSGVREGLLLSALICDTLSDASSAAKTIRSEAEKLQQTHVMVSVPINPTHEMLVALTQEWHPSKQGNIKERYAAMLQAAQEAK